VLDSGAVAEYAAHLRRPGHLFHRDVEETIRNREKPLAMPVLAIGGEGALGQVIPDQAQRYAGDVTGAVLPCGHWVAEESPELLLKHLLPFLG
jgi:microsomal epoxide hydrolase